MKTSITELFQIKYPIISGGMVWCSGWRLAVAVSRAGGLGLLGAGSMHPDVLEQHIDKCREAGVAFGVNVPIFYPEIERVIDLIIAKQVSIVFTSGGNPGLYTSRLKAAGCKVVHVVASARFAQKAEAAGVDAVVCEGFEAGGHNGRDEISTMVLTPLVRRAVAIPVIAAGGIATGEAMVAALALGADGVQVGTRFALSQESSAHPAFKEYCLNIGESGTMLALRKLSPVRLVKNDFYNRVAQAESRGAEVEELRQILGSRRSKHGIFEGDLVEGELEIGQAAALCSRVMTAHEIVEDIMVEYNNSLQRLCSI